MVDLDGERAIRLVTLGPAGTCHERAVRRYMAFQGIDEFEIEFIDDFLDGLERIRGDRHAFLVQCSAHPKVHEVTERHWREVFVVDTFIYPTKHLVLLSRRDVERPRSLGIVPATKGYIDLSPWEEVIDVVSKPVVGEELLAGRYDAGLTHMEHFEEHSDELRLDLDIGEIDTTWVVYGTTKRFEGEVIGIESRGLLLGSADKLDVGLA
ncbi:MAG TPA: hypothetical protein VHP56_02315 [Solirubrobacterales bacterium]|jgi:hypothetical protein|nr:hypothetical protein [Solirubrobacterales bacterium]